MATKSKDIGLRIRARRIKLDISQSELAKQVNVSQSAINQYEKGAKTPSVHVLQKLATALDVSIDYLLGATDEEAIFINHEIAATFKEFAELSKVDKETVSDLISILKKRS